MDEQGVPASNAPTSGTTVAQTEEFVQYLASADELAILSSGLSLTSILAEPLSGVVPHSAAEDAATDGPELSLGGTLNSPPETWEIFCF